MFQAGALSDPPEKEKYNPFDGQLTFVGHVLSTLPLNIELGKVSPLFTASAHCLYIMLGIDGCQYSI